MALRKLTIYERNLNIVIKTLFYSSLSLHHLFFISHYIILQVISKIILVTYADDIGVEIILWETNNAKNKSRGVKITDTEYAE